MGLNRALVKWGSVTLADFLMESWVTGVTHVRKSIMIPK